MTEPNETAIDRQPSRWRRIKHRLKVFLFGRFWRRKKGPIYGEKVWSQINRQRSLFSLLPKQTWRKPIKKQRRCQHKNRAELVSGNQVIQYCVDCREILAFDV